jgi:hypothetical protein
MLYINKNTSSTTAIGQAYKVNSVDKTAQGEYFSLLSTGYKVLEADKDVDASNVQNCPAWQNVNPQGVLQLQSGNTNNNGYSNTVAGQTLTPAQALHQHIVNVLIEKQTDGTAITTKTLNNEVINQSGVIVKAIEAGENIDGLQALKINKTTGKLEVLRCTDLDTSVECIGISLIPTDEGDLCPFIMLGELVIENSDFETGYEYYIGADGYLTRDLTAVPENAFIQCVGVALPAGVFIVKIKESYSK